MACTGSAKISSLHIYYKPTNGNFYSKFDYESSLTKFVKLCSTFHKVYIFYAHFDKIFI